VVVKDGNYTCFAKLLQASSLLTHVQARVSLSLQEKLVYTDEMRESASRVEFCCAIDEGFDDPVP